MKRIFLQAPKVALFDLDNTLYCYDRAHAQAMKVVEKQFSEIIFSEKFNFSEELADARLMIKSRLAGTAASHSRLLYYKYILEKWQACTGIVSSLQLNQTYWHVFFANMTLISGALNFLDELRAAGVKTTIITNLTTEIQLKKLIKLGIHEYFDFVVTSEEMGVEKPDPLIFNRALELNSATPRDCIMFGDDFASDIVGATSLGIKTYCRKTQNLPKFKEQKFTMFQDFNQINLIDKKVTVNLDN